MSDANASPRPWSVVYARVLDAEGKTVCVCDKDSMHGRADDETAKADASLIVEAVNERDRLRDIVRRMIKVVQNTLDFAEAMNGIIEATPERIKAQDDVRALLRETRAAIGEGEEDTTK